MIDAGDSALLRLLAMLSNLSYSTSNGASLTRNGEWNVLEKKQRKMEVMGQL